MGRMKLDTTDIEETIEFPLTNNHDLRAQIESLYVFMGAYKNIPTYLILCSFVFYDFVVRQ